MEYVYQKLSELDNWSSSYSQKCQGCFFLRHSVDFSNPSPNPLGSRRVAQAGIKEGYLFKKVVIYPLLACLA